jgi:hypothetical protein
MCRWIRLAQNGVVQELGDSPLYVLREPLGAPQGDHGFTALLCLPKEQARKISIPGCFHGANSTTVYTG